VTHSFGRQPVSLVDSALAKDRLNLWQVAFMVIGLVAPATVVAGVVPTAYGVTQQNQIPAAFLVIMLIFLVFSVGFVKMASKIDNAGAFYSLIARGLGRPVGVAAGFIAVFTYTLLTVALYGGLGYAADANFTAWHAPWHFAWYVYSLIAFVIVVILGNFKITLTGAFVTILAILELLVVAALTIAGLAQPADGHVSLATLEPNSLVSGALSLGALWAVVGLGSVGFETGPVFSEGARARARTVKAVTFGVLILSGVIYAASSWAMAVHYGDSNVAKVGADNGPDTLFTMGPAFLANAGRVFFMTSVIAALLAFQNTAARYLFSLGRDGVLPGFLGRPNRHNTPAGASLLLSVVALGLIVFYAVEKLNPLTQFFFWLGTTGGLGVMLLLVLTSLAVIVFFLRHQFPDAGPVTTIVAPALAFIALGFMVVQIIRNFKNLLGPDTNAVAERLPWAFAICAVLGLAWAGVLYATRRSTYEKIGRGVEMTAEPSQPVAPPPQPAYGVGTY
jgi:amino acid transporter